MSSDYGDLKDLLPLAARACGRELVWNDHEQPGYYSEWRGLPQWNEWNPAEEPGDGAEMEDKLRISVRRALNGVAAEVYEHFEPRSKAYAREAFADHPDEGTARRWASLRVAAAIGRSMK
jgi:hypothetical protein